MVLEVEGRKSSGGVYVGYRSLRSTSRSARISRSGRTGFGVGGGPSKRRAGGVNHPFRTASVSTAFPKTGLRDSLGGPSSATTRSRSVTRIVSPSAARRTYSLSRLLSTLILTALTGLNVTTCCYLVKDRLPLHRQIPAIVESLLCKARTFAPPPGLSRQQPRLDGIEASHPELRSPTPLLSQFRKLAPNIFGYLRYFHRDRGRNI